MMGLATLLSSFVASRFLPSLTFTTVFKAALAVALVAGLAALYFLTSTPAKVLAGFVLVDAIATYLAFSGKLPSFTGIFQKPPAPKAG